MTLFSSLTKAASSLPAVKVTSALPAVVSRDVQASSRFQFQYMNGQAVLYDRSTGTLVQQGYLSNSELYSVVRYIVQKAIRANFYLYEIKDQKQARAYMSLKGEGATVESLQKAETIKKKALVETTYTPIEDILAQPNPEQSMRDFAEMAISYYLLTGERFMQVIEGLNPVKWLHILPSTLMEVQSGELYQSIGGYKYIPTQVQLQPSEIIYSRSFMPALVGNGEDLRGLSPLRALALSIQKSNEGKLSGLRQYQQAGPPGVLSILANPNTNEEELTPEQIAQVKDRLNRTATGSNNRGRIHVMSQKAEWTQLGLSPVDLDILKSGVYDLRDFCRAYGVDSKLFGDDGASTYNNMAEARKAAIVDAVIPAVLSFADDLNAAIAPFNVKGKQYFIDADVSHFPELAEDMNAMADRLGKLPITPNQFLEAMQYEAIDHPLMNEPWFDNMKTPLSMVGADPNANANY